MTRRGGHQLVIAGGRVIDPASGVDRLADVLVVDGKISAVDSPGAFAGVDYAELVDASGNIVAPGFIDLHTHLRTPGEEWKEDFRTGSAAASRGGFTTICAMPNTYPAVDCVEVYESNKRRAATESSVRVRQIGAITVGRAGSQLAPMRALADAGVVGFSDDGDPVESSHILRQALTYAVDLDLPLINHAEDRTLGRSWDMNEGAVATRLGLRGLPTSSETAMIARDIELARLTGGKLHIPHVSAAGSVELIRAAKDDGLRVTAEVTPHHIALNEAWVYGQHGEVPDSLTATCYDTNAKMAPPLRSTDDAASIYEALSEGVIDAIATDHAPHATTDKECTFAEASNGIIGLETAFSLVAGFSQDNIGLVVDRLTAGPARILGDDSIGNLRPGSNADIAIIDPDSTWTVKDAALGSKSSNTPLLGMQLHGRVVRTIVGGETVWEYEEELNVAT